MSTWHYDSIRNIRNTEALLPPDSVYVKDSNSSITD